ncbi:MAG: LiaF transmembrane domain-containing protein [Gammaproteobacteria bacterium]
MIGAGFVFSSLVSSGIVSSGIVSSISRRTPLAGAAPPFAEKRLAAARPRLIVAAHINEGTRGARMTHNKDKEYEWRRQLVWGMVIVGLGVALLLDQMKVIEVRHLWHYAPLALVIIGMNKMVGYPSARHFCGGLMEMMIGLWLFAVFEQMYGLTFFNSWPVPMIAIGIKTALEPIVRARFASYEENKHDTHK